MSSSPFAIVIPADPRHIRIVRLVAGSLCAMSGFDDERVEDVKIALGELASTLLEVGGTSPVELEFTMGDDGRIDVRGAVRPSGASLDDGRFAFTQRVLAVVADHHEFVIDAETATFTVALGPHTFEVEPADA